MELKVNKIFRASVPIASTLQLKVSKATISILQDWHLVSARVLGETSSGSRI